MNSVAIERNVQPVFLVEFNEDEHQMAQKTSYAEKPKFRGKTCLAPLTPRELCLQTDSCKLKEIHETVNSQTAFEVRPLTEHDEEDRGEDKSLAKHRLHYDRRENHCESR